MHPTVTSMCKDAMFADGFPGTDNQLRAWNTGNQAQFSIPYPKEPLFLPPPGNSKGSTEKLKDLPKLTGLVGSPLQIDTRRLWPSSQHSYLSGL